MSNDDQPGAGAPENAVSAPNAASLDFDKATYTAPVETKSCAACKQLIASEYYEAGGQAICTACRNQLTGANGDRWAFWRALGYGGIAAAAGTLVWSLIIHFTGYELGLIAIIVGIAVGVAVRKGSRGRGGWKYQALAMILTYVSITTSYVPLIVKGLVTGAKDHAATEQVSKPAVAKPESTADDQATTTGAPVAHSAPAQGHLPAPIAIMAFLALVWGLALAAPFLAGLSNIMGIIIIAIGLYEAWKLNRAVPVNGPFRLAAAAPVPPVGITSP